MNQSQRTDRRVQRTHQLLMQSAREVIRERGFQASTVQDIANRANVNRATFYAHFVDKYELLETIVRDKFQNLLETKLPQDSKWDVGTFRVLIKTVIEFYSHCLPENVTCQLIEHAIHEELTRVLNLWLEQQNSEEAGWPVARETVAQIVCWVIFGASEQWNRVKQTTPSDQIADDVLLVLMGGLAHLFAREVKPETSDGAKQSAPRCRMG